MAKLWEPNPHYQRVDWATVDNWLDVRYNLENYLPYKRLYKNLSESQLLELLRDARRFHWEALDLHNCALDALPEELGELLDLRALHVWETPITALPESLGQLTNLQSLDLSRTQITTLPESLRQLSNLQSLDLFGSNITTLPESLGCLSKLQKLDFGYTDITTLPEFLGQLSNLQALYLNGNQIKVLPESLRHLSNLRWLYLDNTEISALPESLGQLTKLQKLDFSYTSIEILPESLERLSNLQSLDLSGTQITTLPESLGRLSNLQRLDLFGTKITTLPESLGQLSNLQWLDLRNSKITTLPESLGRLTNLKTLNLSDCHLQSIPYSVVQLGLPFVTDNWAADNCVNLTGVTLDEGDLSLFAQPREVIEEYYRNRMEGTEATGEATEAAEREAAELVQECKVIFLGDGAAGKSSLIERMIRNKFKEGSLPTDGIKMTKWSEYADGEPLTLDGKPLTLRFLDFGGQEIMHSMHRCFLTAHTVYVVVCESRDDAEIDSVAARWMETVKSFAPECPVLLALNKADLNPHVTVNERTLRERNPQYRHLLRTSAKTGQGVEQLTADILAEVPGCLQRMAGNRGFLGLKRELEDMEADYILPEDFQALCDRFQIREDLRAGVLNWFQDLGVAYPYSATFRDIYVLNPAWLTNGIYRLILRAPNGGFLKHSDIRETLGRAYAGDMSAKTYTAQEMEFILYIMRKFEISLYLSSFFEGFSAY